MRKICWVLAAVIFMAACKKNKEKNARVTGTLTEADGRKCACCGGVYLTIDNRTGQYRTLELPSLTPEQLRSLNFPQRIEFEYQNAGDCGEQLIEITSYTFIP
jgi:hypothetical protein